MKIAQILILLFLASAALASRNEAGVNFLLISPDARTNGMGATGVTSIRGHCAFYNPGNVGLMAFEKTFAYSSTHSELYELIFDKYSVDAYSITFAGNSELFKLNLPFNAGLGIQYSNNRKSYHSLGSSMEGKYSSYTTGAGVDYFLQLGLGFTYKNITGNGIYGEISAYDYGLTAQLPICHTLKNTKLIHEVLPNPWDAELTFAYGMSRSNNGADSIRYKDDSPSRPLPKSGRDGFSINFNSTYNDLDFIYLTYAREVELDFVEVVKPPKPPGINSGFELGLFDVFEYRAGRMYRYDYYYDKETGDTITVSYNTRGYTIRPTAALRIIYYEFLQSEYDSPIINFIIKNLDFSYIKSIYIAEDPEYNALGNTKFSQYELTFGTDFGMLYK